MAGREGFICLFREGSWALRIRPPVHAPVFRDASMRTAEEEGEPVPLGTPRNVTRTVVINQVGITPGGTRRILQSVSYNFKEGAAGETEE